jgi:hypothetical protein
MSNLDHFQCLNQVVNGLDSRDYGLQSGEMIKAYMRRNMFGIHPETKIHRIFQSEFLEADILHNRITLPAASAGFWKDPLENPLANVAGVDEVTGSDIDYGSLVRPFHALCWTERERASPSDWSSFSHGKPATRITTSAGKLMVRLFTRDDSSYMHRTWLVEVEYAKEDRIKALQNPDEALNRMESTGALLALSAATVRTRFREECEVRLLYDTSLIPRPSGVTLDESKGLVHIPFDWDDFIEKREDAPPF